MTNKKPKLSDIRTAAKLREEMVIRIACIGKKVQPKDFEYLKKTVDEFNELVKSTPENMDLVDVLSAFIGLYQEELEDIQDEHGIGDEEEEEEEEE